MSTTTHRERAQKVDVEYLDEVGLYVRKLDGLQTARILELAGDDMKPRDMVEMSVIAANAALCDEAGNRLFTDDEIDLVRAMPFDRTIIIANHVIEATLGRKLFTGGSDDLAGNGQKARGNSGLSVSAPIS